MAHVQVSESEMKHYGLVENAIISFNLTITSRIVGRGMVSEYSSRMKKML